MIVPLPEIVAIVGEDDDQVTVPVDIDPPFWSTPVALAVAAWPTWIVVAESATLTVVSTITGAGGAVGVVSPPPPQLRRNRAVARVSAVGRNRLMGSTAEGALRQTDEREGIGYLGFGTLRKNDTLIRRPRQTVVKAATVVDGGSM